MQALLDRGNHVKGIVFFLLVMAIPSTIYAEVYQYIDPHGRIYFTDQKQDKTYHLVAKLYFENNDVRHRPSFDVAQFRANRKKFMPLIKKMAARYDLPFELVQAVVHVESSYDPRAESSSGCIGLMQLKPSTARRYGVNNAWPVEDNVRAGSHYLRDLIDMFDGDIRLALAGYNAGENAVLRNNRQIPNYPETKRYVKKVIHHYRRLSKKN
ncbi:MAG: lytic transglycosylase domain-containing protein [Mariprofundaceae bacterium]|nr:lytic transglycosylase domain-containing protein [Mariprofundaceae bacterium]